ncbi:MAG: PucR family transcriptional regulator ligand-binding domain-containing protein, partial [Anaerolineales bacterium]|nr:PucR family transcriptional regulator ligand-binding domain-containing protein [Anaerolineales bacterium]
MAALSIPFTVAEALQLEVFHTARVLAGAGGLQRPIQWVHIVEIPDIPRWVKGGELLLSDAQVLVSDLGRQPDLIEQLHTLGIAGIVFSPLGAVTSLPAALLQAADRARLPVIEVPYEFRYVELTEAILRRLVDREGALIRQAMNTHLRLTRVVLQGGDLTDLARALAELVCCALRLESPDLQTLAQAAWPPARAGSRTAAGPPSLGRFAQADLRQQLLATQIPIRVPAPAREPA